MDFVKYIGKMGPQRRATARSQTVVTLGGIVSKETVCCVGGKVKH